MAYSHNALEHIRAIADKRRAFDGARDLAIFDEVGLRTAEDEFTARDVNLAATKGDRIDAALNASDDILRGLVPSEHKGVGHTRHWHMCVGLTSTVPCWCDSHQPRVEGVLHVASKDAFFDQHVALGRVPLIVDVQAASPVGDGSVVDHRHLVARDWLTEEVGELTRHMARRYGEQNYKKEVDGVSLIKEEMGDILFVLTCLSNQMNIDLEECFDISMRKKTQRDSVRHLNNKKLS